MKGWISIYIKNNKLLTILFDDDIYCLKYLLVGHKIIEFKTNNKELVSEHIRLFGDNRIFHSEIKGDDRGRI